MELRWSEGDRKRAEIGRKEDCTRRCFVKSHRKNNYMPQYDIKKRALADGGNVLRCNKRIVVAFYVYGGASKYGTVVSTIM